MSQTPPERRNPAPGPVTERRLTRLLARWADARRLGTRRGEAIRRAIMATSVTATPVTATPEVLGFEWWWRLLDPVAGTAFRDSFGGQAPSVFAAGASLPAPPWSIARPGLAELATIGTWHPEAADYQPYLRLT